VTACPELSALEHGDGAAHAAACPSCRIVVELIAERRHGLDERKRDAECARFEMLLAARDAGTIGGAAGELSNKHLRTCAA